jgi:hypothetical protein
MQNLDEELLQVGQLMDWNSPNASEYGDEEPIKVEDGADVVVSDLDWDHKLDKTKYTVAGYIRGKLALVTNGLVLTAIQNCFRGAERLRKLRETTTRKKRKNRKKRILLWSTITILPSRRERSSS